MSPEHRRRLKEAYAIIHELVLTAELPGDPRLENVAVELARLVGYYTWMPEEERE
jgi:hypothetical protein